LAWAALPALVLLLNSPRVGQQRPHVRPHRRLQRVAAYLAGAAQGLALEAVGLAADAAVVGVALAALGVRLGDRLAVQGVPALLAHHQPLQQVSRPRKLLPPPVAVLREVGKVEAGPVDVGAMKPSRVASPARAG